MAVDPPQSSPEVPGPLGAYMLLTRAARGGMADVYIAERADALGTDQFIALKLLLPKLATRRKFVDMFVSEGRLGSMLRHENIVHTQGVGVADGHQFIALDLIHGQDLGRLMRRFRATQAPIPIPVALYVVHEVLAGLAYAHAIEDEQGQPLELVNRDVSPANIMLGYDGAVRLIDFGIAQALLDYRSQIGSIKGKVSYMSPEQVRGLALDARSDLFSLGTVLYQLLTSAEPFKAPTEFDQMERVREANPPPASQVNPRVPGKLSHIVAKAMAKEASARYQTADEMREALVEFCDSASLGLDSEPLAGIMRTEFATQRTRVSEEIALAREILENGGISLDDAPSIPISPAHPSRSSGERRAIEYATPPWLIPTILVLLGVAAVLFLIVLLR